MKLIQLGCLATFAFVSFFDCAPSQAQFSIGNYKINQTISDTKHGAAGNLVAVGAGGGRCGAYCYTSGADARAQARFSADVTQTSYSAVPAHVFVVGQEDRTCPFGDTSTTSILYDGGSIGHSGAGHETPTYSDGYYWATTLYFTLYADTQSTNGYSAADIQYHYEWSL